MVPSPMFHMHLFQYDTKRLGGPYASTWDTRPHQQVVSQLIYCDIVNFALTHLSMHTFASIMSSSLNAVHLIKILPCVTPFSKASNSIFYFLCSLIRSFSLLSFNALSTYLTLLFIIMVIVLCFCFILFFFFTRFRNTS